MKQILHPFVLLFLFIVLLLSYESIALLSSTKGEDAELSEIKTASVASTMVNDDTSIDQLMGLEVERCENGDDECLKRRLVAEAHLDYIYTQESKH